MSLRGIAACGLVAADHGVSPEVLQRDYILQIALLDSEARREIEQTFVEPYFDIAIRSHTASASARSRTLTLSSCLARRDWSERTVKTLLSGGSDPVITAAPKGAWTHQVTDKAKGM